MQATTLGSISAAPCARTVLTRSERRTLGGVLGFLAGLAALGPIAALAAAVLGSVAASLTNPRN